LNVAIAVIFFISVKVAGEVSAIVALSAAVTSKKNNTMNPKGVTVRQKKGKRLIGKTKKEDENEMVKKAWRIGVPQCPQMMVWVQKKSSAHHHVVIFVANQELLFWNFLTGSMEADIQTLFLQVQVNYSCQEIFMIHPKPINYERIRKIEGSFAWIPHAFVRQGFWNNLSHHGVLLYLFLVLASDRNGISYYSFDRICSMLEINTDEYIHARNTLIDQSLIAFDGYFFQVLSLPCTVIQTLAQPSCSPKNVRRKKPESLQQIFQSIFLNMAEKSGSHQPMGGSIS